MRSETIARADLQFARLRLLALLLLALGGEQPGFEQGHGARTVLVLRTLVLAFNTTPVGMCVMRMAESVLLTC